MIDRLLLSSVLAALTAICVSGAFAAEVPPSAEHVCFVLLDEERHLLADLTAQRDVEVEGAEGTHEIFVMIEKLWKTKHYERLGFLRAEYLRDASRLDVQRTEILIERSRAKFEVLDDRCGTTGIRLKDRTSRARSCRP